MTTEVENVLASLMDPSLQKKAAFALEALLNGTDREFVEDFVSQVPLRISFSLKTEFFQDGVGLLLSLIETSVCETYFPPIFYDPILGGEYACICIEGLACSDVWVKFGS